MAKKPGKHMHRVLSLYVLAGHSTGTIGANGPAGHSCVSLHGSGSAEEGGQCEPAGHGTGVADANGQYLKEREGVTFNRWMFEGLRACGYPWEKSLLTYELPGQGNGCADPSGQ